jgi:hypothetical protein
MTAVQIYRNYQSMKSHVPMNAMASYYSNESFCFNRALVERLACGDEELDDTRGARYLRKLELAIINKSFPGLMELNRIRPHRFSLHKIISDFLHP